MDMNLQIRSCLHIFQTKTWYKSNTNKVNDMNAVSDSMSEIEKKNVDFLNSYR